MKVHLVSRELGGVGQHHVLHLRGGVACGQSQAAQCVAPRPVLTDHRHDLVLDACRERHFGVAYSDVSAPLDNTLWCTLSVRRERGIKLDPSNDVGELYYYIIIIK